MKNADLFKDTFGTYATEIWSMPENDFLKWLNEDAKPKTGHWIYKQYGGYPEQGNYHCSECDKIDNNIPLYCPHCGAKMEEVKE